MRATRSAQSAGICEVPRVLTTVDNQIDTTTGTVKAKAVFDNQDGALFPNLTALANIGFGLRRGERARAAELLEACRVHVAVHAGAERAAFEAVTAQDLGVD